MKSHVVPKIFRNLFSKRMTVRFPHESIEIPDGYRGEQEYDIDKCISCGLCARICPNRAISMIELPEKFKENHPKKYPEIDLGKCCFCGLCQDICPTGSIRMSKNVFLSTFSKETTIKSPIGSNEDR